MKHKDQGMVSEAASQPNPFTVSASEAFVVHLICGVGLAAALWFGSFNLISRPSETLFLIWAVECPLVILLYSWYRQSRQQCSYWRAVCRSVVGLLVGALVCAFGAIALGAPVSAKYLSKTISWSLVMSSFTVVPAASVFGSSWADWQRIFAHTKPVVPIDFMICLPAHGAVLGAWFGAWPMPLDWERQWQEWPICVSYGAIAGYLIGMVASIAFVFVHGSSKSTKTD